MHPATVPSGLQGSSPTGSSRTLTNCRICGGDRLEMFLSLGRQPHCNSFLRGDQLDAEEPRWPLDLLYCRDCHLVQLTEAVDPKVMFRQYVYVSGTTRTLTEHFRRSAETLVAGFGTEPGSLVVDIGSNDGTFLRQFKDLGMRVVGVDPATNVAAAANHAGIETVNDFFGERVALRLREERGPAQLMTAAGVFFHIDDMDDVCRGVAALLDDDGIFQVQAIYLGDMLAERSFDNVYHEHVSYYTLRPLIRLFERFGLRVFDVGHSTIHGGTLLVHVCKGDRRPVQPSVGELLDAEHARGLDTIGPYLNFAEQAAAIRHDLVGMLSRLREQGRRLAAYGAPAKGNTLLNYCGIGIDLLECAAEVAPLKIGLYTPGMHIPVRDEREVMADPPDAFLLLPWNFADELLGRNRPYRERGGRFVVPIPTPRLV